MKDVTIIVAAHKKSEMPTDLMYLPLQVGAEGKKDQDGAHGQRMEQKRYRGNSVTFSVTCHTSGRI